MAKPTPPLQQSQPVHSALSAVNITFLGTASAQPSSTRNHSSLALRLGGDVWLFDCGEATQHQVQRSTVKMGRIEKIFITHTHGDHIFGLLPLLAGRLNGAGGMVDEADETRTVDAANKQPLEIYGPLGTRAYVRSGLAYTHTLLGSPYVVHELRLPTDPPGASTALPPHACELPGRDIPLSDGVWRDILAAPAPSVSVSAAPLAHSVPCVGYVVSEAPVPGKIDAQAYVPHLRRTGTPLSAMRILQQGGCVELPDGTVLQGPARRPGRKIAVLGDTYDPAPIAALAQGADVLVHEATNAHLPGVDPDTKDAETYETLRARSMSRGHSTPQMAGTFARRVGAKKLLLNHFSARYAGNDDVDADARRIMEAIRDQAQGEFGGEVICARDFMSIDVPLPNT
ncbi:Metallo-hydrolase/oxidoreductase [Auriscalpium vulgare]|uniref:Metallo-hydrolase/oxidoreductase n=1 Tax=Auriscalpium vulgare TaxID=40419 RepID=A0ACB8S2D0_9AGAM|nr:Metallo-hydrolase/oxidoreductase [Auriscalpium vulgare]